VNIFNQNAECMKCGHEKIGVRWCRGVSRVEVTKDACECHLRFKVEKGNRARVTPELRKMRELYREDHLERRCKQCGYRWLEKPLDRGHPLEQLGACAE